MATARGRRPVTRRGQYGPEARMPLLEHLLELRNRIFVAACALAVGTIAAWFFFNPIWDYLKQPYCKLPQSHELNGQCALVVNGLFEGFFLRMKVSFILAIIATSPIWLYEIWAFITPGLRQRERKWTVRFLLCAIPLFLSGALLAWLTVQKALQFLLGVKPSGAIALIPVSNYLGLLLAFILIYGLSFEFPLIVIMLNFMGVLTYERLIRWWRGITLGIAVFAAVVTPSGDPITMTALGVPMWLLYWVAVGVAKIHDARKARREAAAPYADMPDDEGSSLDPIYDPSPK
jgi:sec-independent protein translocase protein TatC